MTVSPQYYTTQSQWQSDEETQWDDMITKLGSFDTAQAALKFITLVMAEFLINYSDGLQSWTGYDLNASSGLETDLSNIMSDVNKCENGKGSISDVSDAVANMNDFLVQVWTDPALENTQLQTQAQNSFEDMLGDNCTIQDETVDVYYDGSTTATQVSVPQLVVTPDQEQDILDDWDGAAYVQPGTSSEPEGGDNPAINPTDEGYQEYLSEQSQWMTDLTTVDDSCGEIDQMAQAEYSQDQSNQKMEIGTLFQLFKNESSVETYWNQQGGKS